MPLEEGEEDDSPFPTLEEAANMVKATMSNKTEVEEVHIYGKVEAVIFEKPLISMCSFICRCLKNALKLKNRKQRIVNT